MVAERPALEAREGRLRALLQRGQQAHRLLHRRLQLLPLLPGRHRVPAGAFQRGHPLRHQRPRRHHLRHGQGQPAHPALLRAREKGHHPHDEDGRRRGRDHAGRPRQLLHQAQPHAQGHRVRLRAAPHDELLPNRLEARLRQLRHHPVHRPPPGRGAPPGREGLRACPQEKPPAHRLRHARPLHRARRGGRPPAQRAPSRGHRPIVAGRQHPRLVHRRVGRRACRPRLAHRRAPPPRVRQALPPALGCSQDARRAAGRPRGARLRRRLLQAIVCEHRRHHDHRLVDHLVRLLL